MYEEYNHCHMGKTFVSSSLLLPVLNATSIAFSRLYDRKEENNKLSVRQRRVYGNVEDGLREGVSMARNQSSVYSIYRCFAIGCLKKANCEEAAILGLMAYECAMSFKGKSILTERDWGEGFTKAYEVAKSLYKGPILFEEGSILKRAYSIGVSTLDDLIKILSHPYTPSQEGEVFFDFLKAAAMGFASPMPLKEEGPFDSLSPTRLAKEGYCLSFFLQCLNAKNKPFDYDEYASFLSTHAEEAHIKEQGGQVFVDCLTYSPAPILDKSQEYGEFVNLKLKSRYLEQLDASPRLFKAPHPSIKGRAVFLSAPSTQCASIFLDLGAEVVLDKSTCRDIRIEHLLDSFRSSACPNILFLPTSPCEALLGKIASRLTQSKNVIVLPSLSLQEAYFALSTALFEEEGIDALSESLCRGIEAITPYEAREGELRKTLQEVPNIEEAEICFIMGDASKEEIREALAALEKINPYLEAGVLDIGNSKNYLIGVSR